MASVKKCDICGEIYSLYPEKDTITLSQQHGKSPEFGFSLSEQFDCCPECTSRILEFVDVLKDHRNDYTIQYGLEGYINGKRT